LFRIRVPVKFFVSRRRQTVFIRQRVLGARTYRLSSSSSSLLFFTRNIKTISFFYGIRPRVFEAIAKSVQLNTFRNLCIAMIYFGSRTSSGLSVCIYIQCGYFACPCLGLGVSCGGFGVATVQIIAANGVNTLTYTFVFVRRRRVRQDEVARCNEIEKPVGASLR